MNRASTWNSGGLTLSPTRSTNVSSGGRSGQRLQRIDGRPSRTEEVMEILRVSIVRGELMPDSLHSVGAMAETLGVSRTPVREALIELGSRGMVRFERNRGVRILRTSIQDLEEIFELRMLLEIPAARRAVERLDPAKLRQLRAEYAGMEKAAAAGREDELWAHDRAFHHALMLMSGNRRLAEYVDNLRDVVLVRGATTAGRSRSLEQIAAEHHMILEAAERGDADAVGQALADHVAHTRQLLIAQEQEALRGA